MADNITNQQTSTTVHTAYLALGSNLENPFSQVKQAVSTIAAHQDMALVTVSSAYKTPPWGITDQPDFINAMVSITTTLSPTQLLQACKKIESDQRRVKTFRWGPRIIDVDIIHIEGVSLNSEELTIPHPRFHERAFVLLPFVEIAPNIKIGDRILTEIIKDFSINNQSSIDEVIQESATLY